MTDLLTRTPACPEPARPELNHDAQSEQDAPASALAGSLAEQLVVVVAPSTGRFRPDGDCVGRPMEPGALLGHVTGGGGRADAVHVPLSAQIADLLVRPGQLVHRGQGLAWLQRTVPAGGAA